MNESSLVPEQQLLFSPALAATIGLEEAILLQQLHGFFRHQPAQWRAGYAWLKIERARLLQLMPFWNAGDLQRIVRALVDKGVLLSDSAPLHSCEHLSFAFNERPERQVSLKSSTRSIGETAVTPAAITGNRRNASRLPDNWSPSEEVLQLLALNHNIPRPFALEQREDFIFYWRERNEVSHAWENKFRQRVIHAWRHQQQQQAEAQRTTQETTTPAILNRHWQPSEDAMEIMLRSGIERSFIEEAVPEFVLYWSERGDAPKELNSRFIQHIRLQWARYTNSVKHSTVPTLIDNQWEPDHDVYDILRLSHIDEAFARSLLPEFIVYWRDSAQAHTSWNSKFLQHVKYHWARQHQIPPSGAQHDGQEQGSHSAHRTRDRSLADDLSDTSWAG
ncbi:MAG: DnaT-like ssDNA-binding domain-containing protein [Parahaliea sp.]